MKRRRSLTFSALFCGAFLLSLLGAGPWSPTTLARVQPASPIEPAVQAQPTLPVKSAVQAQSTSPVAPAQVAWSDVAPVLYSNCTTCHHPHGSGPFSLLTYSDARRWGTQVAQVTASHYMPPWLPTHGYGDFADERILSAAQIALFADWVKAGMPEGNVAKAPPQPAYSDTWLGGKPDLILSVEQSFALPASGTDRFHNFILPYPLQETRYIRAIEIRPSAPEAVHHANVLLDRTASLRRQHPDDWKAGIDGMELSIDSGNTFDPDGHFLFWKADSPVIEEQPGMSWQLNPGNDLVLNMHLKPTGKAMLVSAQIGLYFTPQPPLRQPMLLQLEHDSALDIPAGDPHFVVEDHLTLPIAVSLLGVYPHAHYLGKDLEGWAILPDGSKRWLVWIRDWDIDRQAVYRFREPVPLPKGTTLTMRYTYDNSSANVHNPHSPPLRVQGGNRSEDEMGHLWVQVLPEPGKEARTEGQPHAHAGTQPDARLPLEEAWMRHRLEKAPGDSIARYNLASALQAQGRFAESAKVYEAQLARQPGDARFLNGLGAAQESAGEWQAARKTYQQAVASAPDDCDARFNLGQLDLKHDQATESEAQFRAVLSACAPDAAAHSGLATALTLENHDAAAQAEFQAALQLDPADFSANYSLGVLHLQAGQVDAAVAELDNAVRANGLDLDAREHLALAYAQSGRAGDAVFQLRAAVEIAPQDAALHALLAQVLGSTGALDEAVTEQQKSLKLKPDDADQWNNLGVMEARKGDRAQAKSDFLRALSLQPSNAEAKVNLQRLEPSAAPQPPGSSTPR